jgi:hypothetical protein
VVPQEMQAPEMKMVSYFVVALVIVGCGPSLEEQQQKQRLSEMHRIASQNFGGSIAAGTWGNWRVASVSMESSGKRNIIEVIVDIPTEQAGEIISRPSEAQFRAVGYSACPRSSSPLWRFFREGDSFDLKARMNGHIFIDVDCARWRLN